MEITGNVINIHEPATPDRTEYHWHEADWIAAASLGAGATAVCCLVGVGMFLLVTRRRYASMRERLDVAQREAENEPHSPRPVSEVGQARELS